MNRYLQEVDVPEWMTKGKTTLIQKYPLKGTSPNNYRSITCLRLMLKILASQIREEIYDWLIRRGLFPEEQKGYRNGSRDTGEPLYIDWHFLNESKTRQKNLAMAWIDNKKSYDMVPQSWIINCLKMYRISDEIIAFIEKTMKTWRVEFTAGGKGLAEAKIQSGIFQAPLLFVIAMMPLNHILRKFTAGIKLIKSLEKINELMYMDDIKLFFLKTKRN